jgi:hypothetical protein
MANAALKELIKLQQQTASRSGPKWPCLCGYKTNFSDRTSCYRCLAKKGEGKAPAALQPSQRVAREAPPQAAPAAAAAATPATQMQSPDSELEACRRATVDRLRNLRHLLDLSPGDAALARWVAETETELTVVKNKIHALKTPAARLQACLTKKAAADREVGLLAEAARAAAEAHDLANGKLCTARELQSELEIELRDLRLDGLLGQPPSAPAGPSPVDLMAFAAAIMKAVAPSATLPQGTIEQLAAMCNLLKSVPDAIMAPEEVPNEGPPTVAELGHNRSRSPSTRSGRASAADDLAGSKARATSAAGVRQPVLVTDQTQRSAGEPTPRGTRLPGAGTPA